MKGLGTDDDTLCRVVVSRCEVDMVQIKEEFQRQYKQTLGMFVAVSIQWCSQNAEKVTHIKGRLLDQAVILFNCDPFRNWNFS